MLALLKGPFALQSVRMGEVQRERRCRSDQCRIVPTRSHDRLISNHRHTLQVLVMYASNDEFASIIKVFGGSPDRMFRPKPGSCVV
jgi:hypothetical protein